MAASEAGATLLEPIYSMDISVPEDCMGDIMGDLTNRRGRVLGMDPEPGTEVPLPGSIRLAVSRGLPTFLMPDLAGMTQGEAFALLRALGLAMGGIDRRYSLLNVRLIFGQYPEPYEPVTEGTQVRLIVGREVAWQ